MNWQPIETAPKSKDNYIAIPILAFCPNEHTGLGTSDDRIRIIWWEPGLKRWADDRDIPNHYIRPTHWMSLPEPPE